MLYSVEKQAYKLKFLRSWRIHDVFHMLLLKKDTTRKWWVDKVVKQIEFDVRDNNDGEYKVEII